MQKTMMPKYLFVTKKQNHCIIILIHILYTYKAQRNLIIENADKQDQI